MFFFLNRRFDNLFELYTTQIYFSSWIEKTSSIAISMSSRAVVLNEKKMSLFASFWEGGFDGFQRNNIVSRKELVQNKLKFA